MGPFIIFGLLIYLALIVISVCAYPFICANIAIVCKRYNEIAIGFLLMLTIALYLFASTTLEHALDNWCYSVYAGIAVTPIVLYFCIIFEDSDNWPESGEKNQHKNITISILTLLTSSLFAIEGVLRMADSYSIHRILNYGWGTQDVDSYRYYYETFQYAGSLLFIVSLFSVLIIGIIFFTNYKNYRRELSIEEKKKSRIEKEIKEITHNLKADSDFLMSFETHQVDEAIQYYYTFCQKIIAALESSDEKTDLSYEHRAFNNIETSYKVLLLSNSSSSYYIYPMGIVDKNHKDSYKYIPNGMTTVLIRTENKNMSKPLPNDVRPVSQFWLHSCRDGSPDLRYKYNPKTYVYEYGILSVAALILHVFRINTTKDVVNSYNQMFSYISQLKEQKLNEKRKVLSEEKATTPTIIIDNKVSATNAVRPNDTKTEKLHVVIENPKTLEECFSVIIIKHSPEILKDNKLISIISSYKEVDISEYKEVLDRMVTGNFLYQFIDSRKQNDFTVYNLSSSFARHQKTSIQRVLFIAQALVKAIKKLNNGMPTLIKE